MKILIPMTLILELVWCTPIKRLIERDSSIFGNRSNPTMQVMMKFKINGSIFILFLINHLTSCRIRFLIYQDDQFKSTENQLNQKQLNDKNEIIKRV